jgi:hypothetical protein
MSKQGKTGSVNAGDGSLDLKCRGDASDKGTYIKDYIRYVPTPMGRLRRSALVSRETID